MTLLGLNLDRQTFYRVEVVLYDTTSPDSPAEGINVNDTMLKERLASPDHDCLVNDVKKQIQTFICVHLLLICSFRFFRGRRRRRASLCRKRSLRQRARWRSATSLT